MLEGVYLFTDIYKIEIGMSLIEFWELVVLLQSIFLKNNPGKYIYCHFNTKVLFKSLFLLSSQFIELLPRRRLSVFVLLMFTIVILLLIAPFFKTKSKAINKIPFHQLIQSSMS